MKSFLISFIISVVFLVLTGWIGLKLHIEPIWEFCFMFHLIPYGIAFGGGSVFFILLYYLILLLVTTLLVKTIIKIVSILRR